MTERLEGDELIHEAESLRDAATDLFVAVWRALQAGQIPDRSPIDDAALRLRDVLNPHWPNESDWLPPELREE